MTAVDELAKALCKAQKEIKESKIDAEAKAGTFSYEYSTLTSVWHACKEALHSNGLSIVQMLGVDETGYYLETRLLHISGQYLSGKCPLILQKQDMQGLGSATSYARRYSIAAICGVVQEDDDAQGAGLAEPHKNFPKNDTPISEAQAKRLFAISVGAGWSTDSLKTLVSDFGYESSRAILKKDYEKICAAIERGP